MAAAARSKSFEGNGSPILPNPAAMAAAAAAAASRPYLPNPYLPNFAAGAHYRHPLLPFTSSGYNLAATPFHSLLAGLSRPKLDEYQSLLTSAAAAAGLPPPPPVSSPPTTGSATSPTSPVVTNKSSSNPPSPVNNPDDVTERKNESINALRLKAKEHEAKLEESVKNE